MPYPGGKQWTAKQACIRHLVWKDAVWNATQERFLIGSSPLTKDNPDWKFRAAFNCGIGFKDKKAVRLETSPVLTKCWDLNPVTDPHSDFDEGCFDLNVGESDDSQGFNNAAEFFAAKITSAGRYIVKATVSTVKWVHFSKNGDEYGPTAKLVIHICAFKPTQKEVEEIESFDENLIRCE